MTRVFTDGAEFGDNLLFSTAPTSAPTTSQKRSGNYSYQIGSAGAIITISPVLTEFYFRIGHYYPVTQGSSTIINFRKGVTSICSIRFNNSTQRLEAVVGSTLVATGTTVFATSTWYLIEVHIKIADSNGDFEIRLDGVEPYEIDFSGDTKPGADTTIDNIQLGRSGSSDALFDDLALNNTDGITDNSWCDDGHIVLLNPDSDGDVITWSGSDGDMTDNYLLVDEIPSDGDTTYVESVTVSGYDLYNLEASALTGTTIRRIWVESRTKNTVAAGGQVAHVIKTGGTEYVGSGIDLLTSYRRSIGEEYAQNPNTAAAWTVANLDALQVGPLVKSTG